MKNIKTAKIIALLITVLMAATLFGCGNKQRDIMEEPDITVDYLSGEYADQLVRDGAEVDMGTISLEENEDGTYSITVNSMLIVESENGYYIADKNMSSKLPLDSDARMTYISDKEAGPEVINIEQFIENIQSDTSDPLEEGNEKLYDVYTIGDTALLVLAKVL